MATTEVTLLLGSNDTEAAKIVRRATTIVGQTVGDILRTSQDHRSKAYGFTSDNEFVNRAIVIKTSFDAYEVLRRINLIEALLGRNREEEQRIKELKQEEYASRPIDIDIIFFGQETFSDQRLTIPYHFLAEREYALRPVVDVMPDFKHPTLRNTPREMLRIIENTNI